MKPTRHPAPAAMVALVAATLGMTWAAIAPAPARATSPIASPHGSLRAECSLCHGSKGWTPAQMSKKFDHGDYGFRLEGAHRSASCLSCHQSLDFAKADTRCASCHLDPHKGELGTACERCHTARSFLDRAAMTRMHQETRLPLIGAHLAADCERCHKPQAAGRLRFVSLPAACQACHMPEYVSAKDPDHATGGFSLECESCHRPISWHGAAFNHDAGGFPLTGAHKTAACASCHIGGVYAGTSRDCASCHQNDYNGTTNPNHTQLGFPTTCASCHGTIAWEGATFDHATTAFPLTGTHRTVACLSCHVGGVYSGTNSDCASCHQSDYNGTTNPNHTQLGFPLACATCHTTTNWNANFTQHDTQYFPIYSGTHAGRWTACTDCHTQSSNFAIYDCLGCHPHSDKAKTDSAHTGESGYQYLSTACFSCHPQGRP